MERKSIRLLEVTIDNLSHAEALKKAEMFLHAGRFHQIVTPGPEFLLEATANRKFRDILNQADLSLPDGMGLHVGTRMTSQKLKQRIPGADFVVDLLHLAARRGSRVFLFGGRPGVAEKAGQRLLKQIPGLAIVGIESGWRGNWNAVHDRRIIERIHLAAPDILLVALGAPKQELWIDRHRAALHKVSIAIGIGRTLDYLAGHVKRAPAIVRRTGFEWLYTYLTAGQFYQPEFRRQRVKNATFRFVVELIRHRRAPRF